MKYYCIKDDFTKDLLLFTTKKELKSMIATYKELEKMGIYTGYKVGRCNAHYKYNGGVK